MGNGVTTADHDWTPSWSSLWLFGRTRQTRRWESLGRAHFPQRRKLYYYTARLFSFDLPVSRAKHNHGGEKSCFIFSQHLDTMFLTCLCGQRSLEPHMNPVYQSGRIMYMKCDPSIGIKCGSFPLCIISDTRFSFLLYASILTSLGQGGKPNPRRTLGQSKTWKWLFQSLQSSI